MAGHETEELVFLKGRVAKLIEAYRTLENERDNFKELNCDLSGKLGEKKKEIDDIKVDFNRVELSGAILGDGEKSRESKKRINDLVREIDNCIALLNNI